MPNTSTQPSNPPNDRRMPSSTSLSAFIAELDCERIAQRASELASGKWQAAEFEAHLNSYLNEAQVGLDLIKPHLTGGQRILEVGAGVGVLTAYLKSLGYEVFGIEPGEEGGFGFMPAMSVAISEALPLRIRPELLPLRAEQLEPGVHGRFDLIFSVNVMEHVMALDDAMVALAHVLSPHGKMTHLCPNYAFPYEPHLGIPLVPFAPQITKWFFPATFAREQRVWDTVNFITARRVRRLATRNSLSCTFSGGVMERFFIRARTDSRFRERQAGLIARIATNGGLAWTVAGVLRRIPAALATPMIFTLCHADELRRGVNEH